MGIAENKRVIRDLYDANNRGDVKGFMAFLDEDVRWTNIGSTPFSGSFSGKENIASKLLGPLFSRLKNGITATIDNVVAEGDFVVVQLRGQAETIAGTPYNNTYCHIFRIDGGKIREVTEFFDTDLANRVLVT
jgi:ketosteroid isomerase-like protein